jgi:hypothetical protein
MAASPVAVSWVEEMERAATRALRAQERRSQTLKAKIEAGLAKLDELGELVDSRLNASVTASTEERKEKVKADLRARRFGELTRRELRIAASLLFQVPIATLKELVVARPESHGMLVEAFCNQWTVGRDEPRRRELATLVMGAPPNGRVLHRGINVDLRDAETPANLVKRHSVDFTGTIDFVHNQLGCRNGWQFGYEALAAWVEMAAASEGAIHVWRQIEAQPRAASPILPALSETRWVDGWPEGGRGGSAPLRTQVTVVRALLQLALKDQRGPNALFIDKLLRLSSFGDPRASRVSEYWRALQARDPILFGQFVDMLMKEDLDFFFQRAMSARDRKDFWLSYVGPIRRTIAVLAKDTHQRLDDELQGSEAGRRVLARTRVARRGRVNAFCLLFDRVVVVEFSEVGNAAYVYQRDVFEQKVYPEGATIDAATDLRRGDLPHSRVLHHTNWQTQASELLSEYGVERSPPSA